MTLGEVVISIYLVIYMTILRYKINSIGKRIENLEKKLQKESKDSVDKKDCATCIGFVDKDYEQSFCHDCVKGIQNNYKAESEVKVNANSNN